MSCCWVSAADIRIETTRYRVGDDLSWSARNLDHGSWSWENPADSFDQPGIWWSRTEFVIEKGAVVDEGLLISIRTLASYEVYWDGIHLGNNGIPATSRETEIPGAHLHYVVVPRHMAAPGRHVLALRQSSWWKLLPSDLFALGAGPVERVLVRDRLATGFYMAVFALVLAAGLSFLTFGRVREPALKRFGWLCIAVALLLALENGKYLVLYPYSWHSYRLVVITSVTIAVAMLLPWFLMARFGMRHRGLLIAAMVPPFIAPTVWIDPDHHCYWIFIYSLAYALFLCVKAARNGVPGWAPITTVIGVSFLLTALTGDRFADRWFFPSFLLMVALLAIRLVWETRGWRKALIAEQLTSARLQMELLRKSIQPHFLKNTLAAAMAWFEENPTKGARLLGSLADELDGFFKIGDQERILLDEELALCRHHVETMSLLLDCPLNLEVKRPSRPLSIPPGLLITCVENALTHGRFDVDAQTISIQIHLENQHLFIRVTNPAEPATLVREGTGTRYLRALLARHYSEAWSLDSGFEERIWVSEIEIRNFSDLINEKVK